MLYKREGYPQNGEIVMCTVTKVYPNSVFVNLDEYGHGGMISISEVSAGRIRNIRDFVAEGKVIFCKVLKLNYATRSIELSLRRVSEVMRREKSDEIKKEQMAEKMIEFVAQKGKRNFEELYHVLADRIGTKYNYVHKAFEDVAKEGFDLTTLGIEKGIAAELNELIKLRYKPQEIKVGGTIGMVFHGSNGVKSIKEAFEPIMKNSAIDVKYLGGGKYQIELKDIDYKNAERVLASEMEKLEVFAKEHDGTFSFERVEIKE